MTYNPWTYSKHKFSINLVKWSITMSIKNQVGLRVKQLRLSKGISQEKLALEIGLDRTYISSIESGKRNVSVVNLEKIWSYFSLTPFQFFDSEVFEKNDE